MPTTFKGKRLKSEPVPLQAPQSIKLPKTMDAAELMTTARAAARLALRGANFPEAVREDCRSHLLVWAIEKNAQSLNPERFSREDFSYGKLAGEAANYRRSIESQRARDAADVAARSAQGFRSGDKVLSEDRPSGLTPETARDEAVSMLSALGLPRLGRSFPVVYAALRQGVAVVPVLKTVTTKEGRTLEVPTGVSALEVRAADVADVAAELGISVDGLRKLAQRFPDKVPSNHAAPRRVEVQDHETGAMKTVEVPRYGPDEIGSALGIEDESSAARHADRAARQNHSGDRERPDVAAPVTCHVDRAQRHDKRRKLAQPEWVGKLTQAQRDRLEHAAQVKRDRAAAKTPAQRRHDRQSVGLPATVR